MGVRRRHQRRDRAALVPLVAAADVGEDRRLVGRLALAAHLQHPSPRPHLGRRGHVDLHVGLGADHRPDVAAVEHGAGRRLREVALQREKRRPHLGDRRDDRGGLAGLVALERDLVECRRVDCPRGRGGLHGIVEAMAAGTQRLRHRAIEQPGVEMAQPIMGGEPLAQRALARSRRSVDRDDHVNPLGRHDREISPSSCGGGELSQRSSRTSRSNRS